MANGVVHTNPPTTNNQQADKILGEEGPTENQWGINKEREDHTVKIQEKETQRDKPGIWGSPRAICQFQNTAGRASVRLREAGRQKPKSKVHLISPTDQALQGRHPGIRMNRRQTSSVPETELG